MRSKGFLAGVIIAAVLTLFVVLGMYLANAAIYGGSPSFFNLSQTGYGPGQIIEGSLNFSLLNEPGNTLLRASIAPSNIMKNMTLLEFLKKANAQFNCTPTDCNVTYTASSPATTKVMSLTPGSEAYYGLVAFGGNVQVQNLSFEMEGSSTAPSVCYETPFKFDLLADGTVDFEYKGIGENVLEWCAQRASECFNINYATQSGSIETTPACQKIFLNKTGAVNVSILLSRVGDANNDKIVLLVYDLNGLLKGNCSFNGWEVDDSSFNYNSCVVGINEVGEPTGFYIDKADYYFVCVKKSFGAAAQYLIKKETQGDVCGFYNNPPSSAFTEDYAIYVAEAKFAPFNNEAFFNASTMIGNIPLVTYVQNYIQAKYNNNCTGNGCIIPLKFISLANQQVTLKNLAFKYAPSVGATPSVDYNFYNLTVVQPLLNMSMTVVPFSAMNMTAPTQQGQYCTVNIWLGPLSASRQFKVEAVPNVVNVFPQAVIPNQATTFRVVAISPSNRTIVSYVWNWGDMSADQTTTTPEATHTYTQIGNYTLTVKAIDNASMIGSKSFVITSNITKELINATIESLLAQINSVSSQYSALEPWYRDMVELNLSVMNTTLLTYKSQLPTATAQQLATMKSDIDMMNVPINITDSLRLLESIYYPNLENIEPQYIETVAGSAYDSSQRAQYQNAIAAWQQENVDLRISGQVKTLVYPTTSEDKVTVVNVRLDSLNAGLGAVYLIFSLPSGINYNSVKIKQGSYDIHNLNDAIGFEFSNLGSRETVSLALPGRHDFSSLMFYVSPKLEDLSIEGRVTPGKGKKAPWGLAIFFIILIILIGAGLMWFIWRGYSEKLERKLFKNKGDLYNIMSFIKNVEAKGARKDEINEQLEKAGWTREQINYAWGKLKKQEKEEKKKAAKLQKQQAKIATGKGAGAEIGLGKSPYSMYR